MPATNVDLANTANLEASIAMDDTMDLIVAIAVPMLLILVSLPVTITRVAMIGLNCVAVREEVMSKPLRERWPEFYLPPGPERQKARSKFFVSVADAMANQWGYLLDG